MIKNGFIGSLEKLDGTYEFQISLTGREKFGFLNHIRAIWGEIFGSRREKEPNNNYNGGQQKPPEKFSSDARCCPVGQEHLRLA